MAGLVWVMIGIALWHFAIFVPDHFWSGIVGAFLGAVVGSFLSAIEAVPGAILGMAVVYWIGLRQERLYPAI